ncbi:Glucosamine-6-phosphate deaminase 1 [Rubripirellula tenax]|uniref:Glucosamine-6-phosphate deaminase n=1 Tax=Rubripirellula tenax TaxID=2528015 RepID=A0A5C6FF47_9BACT|nr:glucosamine-6-phosphate deaminase [Rubripirellula tenax]TWU58824.1 Glucosamine-6-phosphate deaminase 1 [Rubripirellula tenax]
MTSSPRLTVVPSAGDVADQVARRIAAAITSNPKLVLGLATGSSPVATYQRLIQLHRDEALDFSQLTTFNLDEYIGLASDHPQSFRHFMQQQLFDHVNIDLANTHVPDGQCLDIEKHVAEYESAIATAGGIAIQLLGIGSNGHIAFNEPGSAADSRTRQVSLTGQTIRANSRFFDSVDDVPRTAITMGIGTIMEADQIILIATGDVKADAIGDAMLGPVSPDCPASLLRMHNDVTFFVDESASPKRDA